MVEHILPEPWAADLPFSSLIKRRIKKKCRGQGCLFGEGYTRLFPDGRLSIQEGFIYEEPDLLGYPFRKLRVPLMVYEALEEFEDQMDIGFGIWRRVRKRLALNMMKDRKVETLILGQAAWKL